jgi:hypothetical protein
LRVLNRLVCIQTGIRLSSHPGQIYGVRDWMNQLLLVLGFMKKSPETTTTWGLFPSGCCGQRCCFNSRFPLHLFHPAVLTLSSWLYRSNIDGMQKLMNHHKVTLVILISRITCSDKFLTKFPRYIWSDTLPCCDHNILCVTLIIAP